ncbi:MAG TPA: hypothetical protein VMT24_05285 [Aggregatilineaceae bacterium]|nr:hypothetical protein [Aggregatilineaceae bacterium]
MSEDSVAALIQIHLTRYPESEIADVYKLLHQAAFGPGHLIASKKAALEWLEQESGMVTPSQDIPLVESIHPDGMMVRLHLRPYLACQGKLKPLLEALVRSAEEVHGDAESMACWWQVFRTQCQAEAPHTELFERREVALFGRVSARDHWPAVRHSPRYYDAYHPAYRVLTRSEAEALCATLRIPFEVV